MSWLRTLAPSYEPARETRNDWTGLHWNKHSQLYREIPFVSVSNTFAINLVRKPTSSDWKTGGTSYGCGTEEQLSSRTKTRPASATLTWLPISSFYAAMLTRPLCMPEPLFFLLTLTD